MGKDKVRVEVTLANRESNDLIRADVLRAWAEDGIKRLTVLGSSFKGGIAMVTLSLDEYVIEEITLRDGQYVSGYSELYFPTETDQVLAFECLESICEENDLVSPILPEKEMEEDEVSDLVGPKRLEIIIRARFGATERKLVLVDLVPPSGHYKDYSVTGREWKTYPRTLTKYEQTYWGTSHWLARIDYYHANNAGSTSRTFSPQNQEGAWSVLEKMFLEFQRSELEVVKRWEVDDTPELGSGADDYSANWDEAQRRRAQHWTNRSPHSYTPYTPPAPEPPQQAFFRVAGDEVGAVIYREQQKSWEEEGMPSPTQSLERILEAAQVGTEEASQVSDDSCPECGGDNCHPSYCIADFTGLGGVVADGGFSVH